MSIYSALTATTWPTYNGSKDASFYLSEVCESVNAKHGRSTVI